MSASRFKPLLLSTTATACNTFALPATPHVEQLRLGLDKLGYVEGQNILLERRFDDGHPERLPGLGEELVALKVDLIVALTTPAALAAKIAWSSGSDIITPARCSSGSEYAFEARSVVQSERSVSGSHWADERRILFSRIEIGVPPTIPHPRSRSPHLASPIHRLPRDCL